VYRAPPGIGWLWYGTLAGAFAGLLWGSLVRVFFEKRNKTRKLNSSSNPEFVARLLLIELVCRV